MTHYIKKDDTYTLLTEGALDISQVLPPSVYQVRYCEKREIYYLGEVKGFTVPSKLYGDVERRAARVISTFHDRPSSTGILLSGDQGSGKSLLAKRISVDLQAKGIPTLLVTSQFYGNDFNTFIQSIDQDCVILLDEFDKVYTAEHQPKLLTLLDGVYSTKKLFILTANDAHLVDRHMHNRPGRLFYNIRYKGVSPEFIKEYCSDVLEDQSKTEQICKIAAFFESFNFDMLQALVEELNRYGESVQDALSMLNALPTPYASDFDVELVIDGEPVTGDLNYYDDDYWHGTPYDPNGVRIRYYVRKGEEVEITTCTFDISDLLRVEPNSRVYEFRRGADSLRLTRRVSKHFSFEGF